MSTNNHILNLLNIKDIHIIIEIKAKVIKNENYKIVKSTLTYNHKFCSCCGIINKSSGDIIKCVV